MCKGCASLLAQRRLHPCGALLELEASNEPYFFLDQQTNRDIRLMALLRKLSSFSEASAALLGQVQVCILVAPQQGPVEPLICLCFSIKKQTYCDIRLIAFWKPVPHFLVKCRFASLRCISKPCRALNM